MLPLSVIHRSRRSGYLVERVHAGNGTGYRLSHLLAMHQSMQSMRFRSADLTELSDAEFF